MPNIVIDFETYFDKDVSLRKLPTLLYIRHPKFKVHGAAIKVDQDDAFWLTGEQLASFLKRTDWSDATVISHNSLFDLTVLHEHYGVTPAYRADTLGLCRAVLPRDLDLDLDSVGPLLGFQGKKGGGAALQAVKGVVDPTQEQLDALGEYAIVDAEICAGIFEQLYPMLPARERRVMDLVLRISTQGVFEYSSEVDQAFDEARSEIENHRMKTLEEANISAATARSRDKFAAVLQQRGVEPPTKISERTGKLTWAFSKQDPEFVALQADERAAALVAARLAWASNNAISRIESLQQIINRPPYTLPVQVAYHGGHTGRLAGSGKINTQNLNARGRGAGIRKGFRVRDDYVVLVLDLSGIELRLNMWLNGQWDAIETIRQGGDLYVQQAAAQFGIPESEVAKFQRQFGKILELGLGFGMGGKKFRVFIATGPMGLEPIYISEAQAHETVQKYRAKRNRVAQGWQWFNNIAIPQMYAKQATPMPYGPVMFEYEGIRLPNGLKMTYPNLEPTEDGWVWGLNGNIHNVWGGVIDENIVQALAGCLIKEQMDEIDRLFDGDAFTRAYQAGRPTGETAAVIHQVHDEILIACREQDVDKVQREAERIMTTNPPWADGLPLGVEGGYAQEYSK